VPLLKTCGTEVLLKTTLKGSLGVLEMATVFVMINTELGSESMVLKRLNEIEGVKEAFLVYGVYDIIARIETETMQELKDIVALKVRRLDNVRSTLTMIVIQ